MYLFQFARSQPGVSGSLSLPTALARKVGSGSARPGRRAGCAAASIENVRLRFLGMVTTEKSTGMSYLVAVSEQDSSENTDLR